MDPIMQTVCLSATIVSFWFIAFFLGCRKGWNDCEKTINDIIDKNADFIIKEYHEEQNRAAIRRYNITKH